MDPFEFTTRDGATVFGYITKSRIGDSSNSPTIVHPHGGPEGIRDRWGFDHRSQMLASEGFNVLQINFRGSGGYGLSYERFIRGNWDGVLTDLFDAWTIFMKMVSLINITHASMEEVMEVMLLHKVQSCDQIYSNVLLVMLVFII